MNSHSKQIQFVPCVLILISASVMIGCQSTRQQKSACSPSMHSNATVSVPNSVNFPSNQAQQSGSDETVDPQESLAQENSPEDSVVVSVSDAEETFRRLRGKLRANDSGAIVEADFSFSDVNDETLVMISLFTEIKELDLTGTDIHDEALTVLLDLPRLQSLKLKGTRVSSNGMALLTQITSLVLLDGSNTDITDDSLQLAGQWTNLHYLTLNNTAISDAAIPNLKAIKSLKGLALLNTSITEDGARALKEALPECLIVTKSHDANQPSASIVPLRSTPGQNGVAFQEFPVMSDAQLEQLIELAGKQPQLAVHLASVYSSREQWKEASLVLAAAVAADPNQQPLQLALGLALARSGNLPAAKTFLAQAIGDAAANYNLGLIEYENSLRICALHLRQAIDADPSLSEAQTRLLDVQRQLRTLKQQQSPVMSVSSRSVISDETAPALEVIPAPHVRSATFSHSYLR